jgi:hypothetical protein
MNNIVQFPGAAPDVAKPAGCTPALMLAGARSLWQTGVISSESFFLAAQVCYRFITEDSPVIAMSWAEGRKYVVYHGNEFIAGPLQSLRQEDFAFACLDLHTCCGVVNSLDKKFFNPAGNPRQHFTVPHPMRKDVFWDENTPVYFRLRDFEPGLYETFIQRQMEDKLVNCSVLTLARG